LTYVAAKQTNRQTDPNILATPTDSVSVGINDIILAADVNGNVGLHLIPGVLLVRAILSSQV